MSPALLTTLAALVALAAATPGCARERRRFTAERVVRAYDEAVAEAYRMSDPGRLKDLAGAREVGRVQVLIDLKRAAHLVLESRLEAFEVRDVRAAGAGGLVVRTRERWRYHDRSTEPGRPLGPVFVADMEMEWDLVRENGTWKVDKGRTRSCEYLEPQGFKPAPRPAHGQAPEAAGDAPRGQAARP